MFITRSHVLQAQQIREVCCALHNVRKKLFFFVTPQSNTVLNKGCKPQIPWPHFLAAMNATGTSVSETNAQRRNMQRAVQTSTQKNKKKQASTLWSLEDSFDDDTTKSCTDVTMQKTQVLRFEMFPEEKLLCPKVAEVVLLWSGYNLRHQLKLGLCTHLEQKKNQEKDVRG